MVGISRTTALGWRPKKGSRAPGGPIPDSAQLYQLAQRGLSLDWLLLGREPMEWQPQPTTVSPSESLRSALLAEYVATEPVPEPPIEIAGSWKKIVHDALPPADVLLGLCVELLRPLAREAIALVADRTWRRGAYLDEEFVRLAGRERGAEVEATKEAEYRQRLANLHGQWEQRRTRLAERNRKGQVGYQFVTERQMLGPIE
jgi:hypothetical protein